MDKKLIFNEHGERGTQSMIGGNTTNLREWNRIKYDWRTKCTAQCSTTSGFLKRFP